MQKVLIGAIIAVAAAGLIYFGLGQNSDNQSGSTTDKGRVVFALTDAAADLQNVSEVRLQVEQVQVQGSGSAWITVMAQPKEFDLLKLKQTGTAELLADASLEAGTYNQIRLDIGKVIVISDSGETEAKLPSSQLKIVGRFTVEAGTTSTVLVDVLLDKSLHVTGNGKYILTPVVKFESKSQANAKVESGNKVDISGGKTDASTTVGMDVSGEVKSDFAVDAKAKLEVLANGAIHATTEAESQAQVTITAQKAMELAINSGNIDLAISIQLEMENAKKTWKVTGTKNLSVKNVWVDASSGTIVTVQ